MPSSSDYCAVHAHNYAVGRCQRCQQPFCDICRSSWQNEIVCLACLNQIIESREPTPGEISTQQGQGVRSLILAILGWIVFAFSIWLFWRMRFGQGDREMVIVAVSAFLISFVPALLGLGQAAANIRSRGKRLKLATWSFVIASLQVGVTLSLVLLNISHN